MIQITRISMLTGKERSRFLNTTETALRNWGSGQLLAQDAFPELNADEREFIITGTTPEEWQAVMGEE